MASRVAAMLAALGVGLLVFAGGSTSDIGAATSLPTFGQPTISGIQAFGFEQDIRLDPTNPNRVYTSVPGSGPTNTSWIWHSEDGGKTFKWVTAAAPTSGKPTTCAGGGDTELAVDSSGHLYFADLTLANFSTARSDDAGVTFTCSDSGVPGALVDRQWYATDGDPTNGGNLYLASDEVDQGSPSCNTSSAGNNVLVMFRSPLPLAGPASTAGIEFGPANEITKKGSCGEGIMGNDEVSPVATRTGLNGVQLASSVHHVYVIHDDATLTKILVARCFPVGFGAALPNVSDPSGLNCVDLPVTSFPGYKTGGNFPTMAIDRAGNLYAVWEQAPVDTNGVVTGDTVLRYAYSRDEGNHWSSPLTIPTPGLHNNVFAWPAAGDDGRVDIAWYGTPTTANPSDPCSPGNPPPTGYTGAQLGGPDATTHGIWSLYMVQTLNAHAATPTFTPPILAGEHYVHKGTIQTIIGGQCGDRTPGDFLQMRVGSHGEAQIAYADSNNILEPLLITHGMYVRQNGGPGLYNASSPVSGDPILLNGASDPAGDGRFEAAGQTSANIPNLDITGSRMTKPAPADCHPADTPCYRVTMTVADLSSLEPPTGSGDSDTDLVWLTQWLVPAATDCTDFSLQSACSTGGKNFFVYAEANNGQPVECFSGESSGVQSGANPPTYTYPGQNQLTDAACSVDQGSPGTITIDVPISQVSLPSGTAPFSDTLFSVTASTMTLSEPANSAPPDPFLHEGGVPFNLIDVVRAYDASFIPPATLTLAPKSQTLAVGKHACVTATVATGSGAPASGVTVRFSVSGANSTTASKSTNTSGKAQLCYEGHKTGNDTIAAFADLNKNRLQDPSEPADTASVTWTPKTG